MWGTLAEDPESRGLSRNRRTQTHTLAEIDTLIDRAARARLCRAVQDAMQYPSPENVATRQGWLSD
jgi:hypothetical protein